MRDKGNGSDTIPEQIMEFLRQPHPKNFHETTTTTKRKK